MHMSNHLKAFGHEVQGSYYVGGKRKKPENRDEVGAVKDHFSEGRQQDNRRQQNRPTQSDEADTRVFEDLENAALEIYEARKSQYVNPILAAELASETIRSLFKDVAPEAEASQDPAAPKPLAGVGDPSLDDLLALMRIASS